MDSSDSLKLDENLARLLAAYDQGIDGGDSSAITVDVPLSPDLPISPSATERPVSSMRGSEVNEGSLAEVLPDSVRSMRTNAPINVYTPPPVSPNGTHRIGRFELRRQLGKGGCGIVFLAYDPKLQREVALKIPRPEMVMNPDAKSRLKREALAAAEFDHPNLVPVFETGEIGALCYIATAFCPGQTLAEWLDRQAFPVPVRQAARLVAIVAEAVQHAHDRGVLHRDLKPNNVILQEMKVEENDEPPPGSVQLRGDTFLPRLVDFGLAKLVERGGPSETGTRQILGTPKYMAPEQAQARREDIGPPADVYALGVILYELLAGRAPYDGASDVEVLRQAVEGRPVPPRSLRPDIPRDLEAICLKAMARGTTQRYRTAIDLADDLRRFLDGRPTIARPLAWPARAGRWFRRNDEIVAIAVLAVTVIFVTGLGSWNWYLTGKLRAEHDATLTKQAVRNREEQEREYTRRMREAFFAWRGGHDAAASNALDDARRTVNSLMEQPEFTYHYLRRMLNTQQAVIVCPAGPVTVLAMSPDGNRFASGHADGTLTLWDRKTSQQLASVKAHTAELTHIVFALGGTRLFTIGKGKGEAREAFGWAVGSSGELTTASNTLRAIGDQVNPGGEAPQINCLTASPDGQVIYAGGGDGQLWKIHLTDSKQNQTQPGAKDHAAITAVAVSPSGKTVLTASIDGFIRRWSSALTPLPERNGMRVSGEVSSLAALANELPVAGFSSGKMLTVTPDGENSVLGTGNRVRWLAVTPNGRVIHNGLAGRIVIDRAAEMSTSDRGEIHAGVLTPDGKTLLTGSQDGIIRVWDLATDPYIRGVSSNGRVAAIGVGSEGASYVVADETQVRRFAGMSEAKLIAQGPHSVKVIRIVENGVEYGVVFERHSALLCDLAGNSRATNFRATLRDNRMPTAAALNPAGTHLAIGDDVGRVRVWAVGNPEPIASFNTGAMQPVSRVVLSDDGRYAAASIAKGVGVWNVETSAQVITFEADEQAVFRLLPSDRIIIAGRNGVVKMRTFLDREEQMLFGHVGRVTALGMSPDGRTLVSGASTGEVIFWDARTGDELLRFHRHSTPVTVIEFASSGRFLVTGGDGQLAVWDARE